MRTSATADVRNHVRDLKTFAEFHPCHLGEHSHRTCRRPHFVSSSLALVCPAMLLATCRPQCLLYGLLTDWVMYKHVWTGRIR